MVLDARLQKLAGGLSARDAARAYVRSVQGKDLLSAAERAQAEEFEATIEAMFLMAAVDGEVAREEVDQLAASIQAICDTTGSTHAMELGSTLAELNARLARDGWKSRLDSLAGRLKTPEARAFAFRLAAGVAFVDDNVAHAEAAAIDAFSGALGLRPGESQEILVEVQDMLFGRSG
jgi:tellurite resistance protein